MSEDSKPLIITADNIVGILVHESNKLASALGVHGVAADWNQVEAHIAGMYEWAQRAHGIVKDAQAAHAAAQPN